MSQGWINCRIPGYVPHGTPPPKALAVPTQNAELHLTLPLLAGILRCSLIGSILWQLATMLSESENKLEDSAAVATRGYIDPHKIDPDQPVRRSKWQAFKEKLYRPREERTLPEARILLTERNLTEFFNPDYCDEHDAYNPVHGPRKLSISEWIQLLP